MFDRLEAEQVAQIRALRARGGIESFFWLDLDLEGGTRRSDRPTYTLEQVAETLGIPERVPDRALEALGDFDERHALAKKFHADDLHVVFPFFYVPELKSLAGERANESPLIEVHLLVHGDYLLTVSREPLPLQEYAGDISTRHKSEEYTVYVALETMAMTAYEALAQVEDTVETLEADLMRSSASNRRERSLLVRGMRARLTSLRRRVAAEHAIFERVGQEISSVHGLEQERVDDLLARVDGQLARIVDGIDAASQALSNLIDLSLNETTYRLTVVATIFLPLSFITGFFGMNFDWMIGRLDTAEAFFIYGLGTLVASAAIAWALVSRRESIPTADDDG
jgi:magnesium transporter